MVDRERTGGADFDLGRVDGEAQALDLQRERLDISTGTSTVSGAACSTGTGSLAASIGTASWTRSIGQATCTGGTTTGGTATWSGGTSAFCVIVSTRATTSDTDTCTDGGETTRSFGGRHRQRAWHDNGAHGRRYTQRRRGRQADLQRGAGTRCRLVSTLIA